MGLSTYAGLVSNRHCRVNNDIDPCAHAMECSISYIPSKLSPFNVDIMWAFFLTHKFHRKKNVGRKINSEQLIKTTNDNNNKTKLSNEHFACIVYSRALAQTHTNSSVEKTHGKRIFYLYTINMKPNKKKNINLNR